MRKWLDSDGTHLDVRGLPAPQPMIEILRLLEAAGAGEVVVAHLDRDPIFLYPELAQRGWRPETVSGDAGEVRLRLTRAA